MYKLIKNLLNERNYPKQNKIFFKNYLSNKILFLIIPQKYELLKTYEKLFCFCSKQIFFSKFRKKKKKGKKTLEKAGK